MGVFFNKGLHLLCMPYVFLRPYIYSFWQFSKALRLFPALRLFRTLEYALTPVDHYSFKIRFFIETRKFSMQFDSYFSHWWFRIRRKATFNILGVASLCGRLQGYFHELGVINSDWKRIRQKCYQFFKNEKFKKIFHLFTCILPNYVPHEITKEFWKMSHFWNMTAGFLLRCQNSLRWEKCLICDWNIVHGSKFVFLLCYGSKKLLKIII